MLREKVAKVAKIAFAGLTMALCVTAFNPATAVKADMLQESEPNGNPATANQLSLNTWVRGNVQDRYDEDWYQFTIQQAGETNFTITPDASNESTYCSWDVEVFDAKRRCLLSFDAHSVETGKNGWAPGKYYIKISNDSSGYGETGTYNLMINNTPSQLWEKERYYGDKTLSNANVVSLNKQYTGKLYCRYDVDYYRLKLKGTNGISLKFTIDDTVSNPGTWKVEFIEYNSRDPLGYDYISTNKTLTVPRCSGDLIVKISNDSSAYGDIYHIKATSKLAATEILSLNGGVHKASLRWKKVSNATGYYIYRSTSSNGYYRKVGTVTGKTSYTDKKSLKDYGYYYYKIVAFRKTGSKITKSAASDSSYVYVR